MSLLTPMHRFVPRLAQILLPEMASLRLVVHEENGKFLGHRILPLDAIQSGEWKVGTSTLYIQLTTHAPVHMLPHHALVL